MYIYTLLYYNCITCNSTLNTYLFFYYKMQVIFYAFRQYFNSIRGGYVYIKKVNQLAYHAYSSSTLLITKKFKLDTF